METTTDEHYSYRTLYLNDTTADWYYCYRTLQHIVRIDERNNYGTLQFMDTTADDIIATEHYSTYTLPQLDILLQNITAHGHYC